MAVDFQHPEYAASKADWQKIIDATQGEDAIKAEGDRYLPRPINASDTKYNLYLQNAVYSNIVGYTADTLIGAAFRHPAKHNIDDIPELRYLIDDVDGNNLSLTQLAQPVVRNTLKIGRDGLLVDFPSTDGPYSKADLARYRYRASIRRYTANSVINWRTQTAGGRQQLSLVVLLESVAQYIDDFEFESVKQYRVLQLDENGYYVQKIYNENKKLVSINDNIRTAKGERLNYIPFVFVGSNNNDPTVDRPPLLDLTNLNLAMYRNSAEVEGMAYYAGNPFLTYYPGKATNETQARKMSEQSIEMGSSKAHQFGENYKVDFNQISTDSLAYDLMRDKMHQMISTGAKLITSTPTNGETAESVKSRNSATTSILSMCVNNTSDAIKQAITYCAHFNGLDTTNLNFEYQINTDFFDKSLDPQVISAQIMLLDNGIVSRSDIVDYLKSTNMIAQSRTVEAIDDDIRSDRENFGT